MDAAKLQTKIYSGYAKAAKRLGTSYDIFRCTDASVAATASGNLIGNVLASFNAQDMSYAKPNKYGQALWYALMDGALVNQGDVLVGSEGTFFVAAKQLHLPILMVQCNRTVTVTHSDVLAQTGAVGYGGATSDETVIQAATPASVLESGRGAAAPVPSDSKNPAWEVLMPSVDGVVIGSNDILTDDLNRRYSVNTAELTDMGWRILAVEVVISRQLALGALMGGLR